jgi:SOS response regulatory protein OraA/RecX
MVDVIETHAMFTTTRPENFADAQALAQLKTRYTTTETTLSRDATIDYLVGKGFRRETAVECLDRLRQQGYIYESANGLRLTDGP